MHKAIPTVNLCNIFIEIYGALISDIFHQENFFLALKIVSLHFFRNSHQQFSKFLKPSSLPERTFTGPRFRSLRKYTIYRNTPFLSKIEALAQNAVQLSANQGKIQTCWFSLNKTTVSCLQATFTAKGEETASY